jgi:hypothetical protein
MSNLSVNRVLITFTSPERQARPRLLTIAIIAFYERDALLLDDLRQSDNTRR